MALLGTLGVGLLGWSITTAAPRYAHSSVYASGLMNPRGLAFDTHGVLYVAEAGSGGKQTVSTVTNNGNEPFHIGMNGRVSRIPRAGQRETLDDKRPSVFSDRHHDYLGPAAVAVVGDDVYVVSATGWTGDPAYDNTLVRYHPDGSKETVFNYSQYSLANPSLARRSDPRADLPGGMPYGMTALDGKLYTTDGNLEFVQEIGPDGQPLRRPLEYPLSIHVLTGITVGPDRALYLTEMGFWPYPRGSGQVTRLTPDGQASPAATGFTAPLGVAFGRDGALYAVEHSAPLRQANNTGRLVRLRPDGQPEVVLEPLNLPTAVVTGPDGNLYVSNGGNRTPGGEGQILRVEVADRSVVGDAVERAGSLGMRGLAGAVALGLAVVAAGLWLH